MSFSLTDLRCGLEWRGTSLSTVFAQRRNVARPAFLAMLADVVRFNRLARRLLADPGARSGHAWPISWPTHRWSPRLPRLVPRPAGVGHLVGRPGDLHADPGPHLRRVLQPPRAARPGRPADVAHGDRRVDPLRRGDPGARCASEGRLHLGTEVAKVRRHEPGRRAPDGEGPVDLRPRDHGHPQRPGPGAAGRPRPTRSGASSVPCATSRTGPPCTPTPALLPTNRRAWASWNYVRPTSRPTGPR